jgi:hypothetical protein
VLGRKALYISPNLFFLVVVVVVVAAAAAVAVFMMLSSFPLLSHSPLHN